MLVIGVVGGIASGKSVVARRLEAWGAVRLDADAAGHEVLEQPDVRAALRARWGAAVFAAGGNVDRAAVAARVFGSGDAAASDLAFLEGLTHPRIRAKFEQQLAALRKADTAVAAVLDAALLLEAGWDTLCDRIVFVDAPRPLRLARAERTRGWSAEQYTRREAAQWDLEIKRQKANTVIDNSADQAATLRQVDQWWREQFPATTEPAPPEPSTATWHENTRPAAGTTDALRRVER